MADIDRLNPAGLRRLVALHPAQGRLVLRPTLIVPEIAGPVPLADVEQRFADYLLDAGGGPLLADESWLAHSLLLRRIAPGNALPISDEIAAIVAAPRLVENGQLSERARTARFATRADDAIAAAIAMLAPDAATAAIRQLAAQHGPDEELLHLALLQAGRALAWRPDLHDGAGELVAALLALLERTSPTPLLAALAPILGALCASPGGKRTRETVLARLREMRRRIEERRGGASFLGEFRALDRPRALADEDYFVTLPDRNVAEAAARILGRSAEHLDGADFVALQTEVLEGELGSTLLPAFVDGLIEAAAISPLAELVGHLLVAPDEETRLLALQIAAQIPLDACADACLACLDDDRAHVRTRAIRAASLLDPARAVPALVARLDDPEAQVCAAAARALVDLGQRDRIEVRRMPGELAVGKTRERTAAARGALGDTSLEVVLVLLPLVETEAESKPTDEAPLVAALGAILCSSPDGLRLAASLVRDIPETLPLIALALAGGDEAPSVALAADLHAELARSLDPIIEAGDEPGMLALELLSRFSLGNAALLDRIVDANGAHAGHAQQILASLAHVRRRSDRAASVLAPWLESREYLAATMVAAAVAGVVLPATSPLWRHILELYELGSIASATAYGALASRARIRRDD